MKKILNIIGISSILLITSCASGIKAPSKGKSVDNVNFKYMNPNKIVENIEINKSDSFDDVFNKLQFTYLELASNNEFGYKKIINSKASFKGNNVVYNNQLFKNYNENHSKDESYDSYFKRESGEIKGSNIDFYYKGIYSTKSSVSYDSYNKDNYSYNETGFAGEEYSSNVDYSTASGRYTIKKEKEKINDKTIKNTTSSNSTIYQYVDQKANNDDIDKTYYGYDSNGKRYSYSLSTFVNTSYIFDYNIPNTFYNEDYKELYDNSFELKDKYIILNIKSKYTSYMLEDAINQLSLETGKSFFETAEVVKKLKYLSEECYTKTYSETQIWIDYTIPYDISDESVKKLAYGYYKEVEANNINKKITYDARYINYYYPDINNELAASLIGIGSNTTYKSYRKTEVALNNSSYKNKIKNMAKKCKKNNIFSKITMYEA
jgi:hypothetical protein